MTRARVRGIYTTALTQHFRASGVDVVQASPPIRRRFEEDFEPREYDVAVETTADRQGVGLSGRPDAVDALAESVASLGVDALSWRDEAPRGSVFEATVERTLGSGAIVRLTDRREGFLPYSSVERHVETGDRLRVQVYDPAPPWGDDRAVAGAELRAFGGLVTLVSDGAAGSDGSDVSESAKGGDGGGARVVGAPDGAERELAGITDLLSTDVPEGWAIRWERPAVDADMAALDDALGRVADRAGALTDALASVEEGEPPRRLAATDATAWVWFGRETRFALDDLRGAVTRTMPGHHRIKAGDDRASAAVDFVEALCAPAGAFPFDVVTRQFGPVEGDEVSIGHGKPDGRLITLGTGTVTARDPDGTVTVRREMTPGGRYDALGVERRTGDVAITKFREGRWWYPTVYRSDEGERRGTYVNVCTPVEVFPRQVRYVDLHVDVVKHADGRVRRVDDDELDAAVAAGQLSEALAEKARGVAGALERALRD